ncbi:MAG: hypothetical protein LBD60_02895 [Puniceicoccales bacterium]|nr:hypothetical protein [Puniceicoccales bacterium]
MLASAYDFERNISGQEYMLTPKKFYEPKLIDMEKVLCFPKISAEKVLTERLREWQNLKEKQKQNKKICPESS